MKMTGVLWVYVVLLSLSLDAATPFQAETLSILSATHDSNGLALTWADLGPTTAYTVESRDSLTMGSWAPAFFGVWPVSSHQWKYGARLVPGDRYFRVSAAPAQAERGKLLAVSTLRSFSAADIQALFAQEGVPGLVAQSDVRAYKVVYETINPWGLRTTASGLIVAPQSATNALPLLSYQHGTITAKSQVPSALQGLEPVIGIAYATGGYLAVLPDYLGLGESPGLHPFLHAQSEATSAIDLLRAARTFCNSNGIALNRQLFLVGYSQGGHATMALHRELEASYTNEFTITASAPMAGPYNMAGATLDDFLSDRAMPNPYYLAYLLASYQSIYQFVDSLAALFVEPQASLVPPLLDGQHDGGDINQAMATSVPKSTLQPAFLHSLQSDPQSPARLALQQNDLINWTPRAPMHLYHCGADQDVVYANSQAAYDSFQRRGAKQVELIGGTLPLDHGSCAPIVLLAAKIWFDSLVSH